MINVEPWVAMFNDSFLIRSFHVVTTAFMTMAFVLAAIAAFKLVKNKFKKMQNIIKSFKINNDSWRCLYVRFYVGRRFICKIFTPRTTRKISAYEWHFDTESNADLVLLVL